MISKKTYLGLFFFFENTSSFRDLIFNFQCLLLFYKETAGDNCLLLSFSQSKISCYDSFSV